MGWEAAVFNLNDFHDVWLGKEINPDANERGKLYLEGGKTSHEITPAAPSSYSEQPTRIQLSDQ